MPTRKNQHHRIKYRREEALHRLERALPREGNEKRLARMEAEIATLNKRLHR